MTPPKTSELAEELGIAISLLVRRIRAHAPPELRELSWTQKGVLTRLESDGPATAAELARAEGVKPQSMAAAIASLEELRLVERAPHPTDGRQIHIRLAPKGVAFRKRIQQAKETWLIQALAKLTKQEQATLLKAAALMKDMK